jgi:hypothetical protein
LEEQSGRKGPLLLLLDVVQGGFSFCFDKAEQEWFQGTLVFTI